MFFFGLLIHIHIHIYVKKTQFIKTLNKGDIVIRDVTQQKSIFHHYKISNFTVTHSQKNPTVYSQSIKLFTSMMSLQ